VHSERGKGSVFTIKLPAVISQPAGDATVAIEDRRRQAPRSTAEVDAASNTAALPPAGTCVLVIDDDRYIRDLVSLHLANRGYDVAVAEDAVVGGRLALAAKPQLIIVDVNMPYLDGPDFVAALKGDPQTSDIPVVFLTSDDDVADRAASLGAFACLKKPIMADRLLDVVSSAI